LQGAINLRGVERSKPSKSGGTARTDHDSEFGNPEPKEQLRLFREWTHGIYWRRGIFDEPHERSPERRGRTFGSGQRGTDRANRCVSLKKRSGQRLDL
jgi:hypothetical protein